MSVDEKVQRLEKRIEKLRAGLRDVQRYLNQEFKGLHLGRINRVLEADDKAAVEG